jgi:hypothetical protein
MTLCFSLVYPVLGPCHLIYQGMVMRHEGSWAMDEFGGAQLGDARLTKRLIKLADRLADAPPVPATDTRKHRAPIDSLIRRARTNVV